MGDGSDYTDILRFMLSQDGKQSLGDMRHRLLGRKITGVRFENAGSTIKTVLQFDDGGFFYCLQPCHDVAVIRELYDHVLQRRKHESGVMR